jgi:hypothetical protein
MTDSQPEPRNWDCVSQRHAISPLGGEASVSPVSEGVCVRGGT